MSGTSSVRESVIRGAGSCGRAGLAATRATGFALARLGRTLAPVGVKFARRAAALMQVPAQAKERPEHSTRRQQLRVVAIALATAVSSIATFIGLHSVVSGYSDSSIIGLTVSGAGTAVIQLLLVWSVLELIDARGIFARLGYLVVYLVVMFFSVAFAVGFWTQAVSGEKLSREDFDRQVGPPVAALAFFEQQFGGAAEATAGLVTHSQTMAEREQAVGDSCGYDTTAKRGPRYRLRMQDAAFLTPFSPLLGTLASDVSTWQSALDSARRDFESARLREFEGVLKGTLERARAARVEPRLTVLTTWLAQRLAAGRNGFTDEDGQQFVCRDETLDALGQQVLASVTRLPELPDPGAISVLDLRTPAAAVALVFSRVGVRLSSLPRVIFPPTRTALTAEQRSRVQGRTTALENGEPRLESMPIGLGIMFDLLIFLTAALTRSRAPRLRESGNVGDWGCLIDDLRPKAAQRKRLIQFLALPPDTSLHALMDRRLVTVTGFLVRTQSFIYAADVADRATPNSADRVVHDFMTLLVRSGQARIEYDVVDRKHFQQAVRPARIMGRSRQLRVWALGISAEQLLMESRLVDLEGRL